jgi:hypothetical protein
MKIANTIAKVPGALQKPFLLMILPVIMILAAPLKSLAGPDRQTITLNADNKAITQILSDIEKQADYRFLFNSRLKDLKQKVTVTFNNAPISDVLKKLFAGTSLTYVELDNNLVAIRSAGANDADITVSGKITNADGAAIPGVSVRLKGSTTGTSSSTDGSYSITVPDNATLVFSSVGYQDQEVSVNGRTTIDVTLASAVQVIDQVVVVGYGTARKKDLTGSVASVSGAELAKQPVLTATQAVQGIVAGVQVITSGDPNALPVIRI